MAERFIQFGNSGDIFGWDNEDGEPSFMSMDASGLISDGDVLVAGGSGTTADWSAPTGAGLGDVVGPASAADEAFARFDTTTGKLLQNSVVKATNAGAMTGITSLVMSGDLVVDTDTLFVDSAEKRVGIGTAIPGRELEIFSAAPVIRLRDTGATASSTTAFMEFGGTDAGVWTRTGWVGDGSSANTDITLWAEIGDLKLGDSSSNSVLTLSGGDTTLTGDLLVDGTLTVNNGLITTSVTSLVLSTTAAGNAFISFDPKPDNGTSDARVRLFRLTNTTGNRQVDIFKGDGSATTTIAFNAATGAGVFTGDLTVDTNTLFVDSATQRVGIGITNPATQLHVFNPTLNVVIRAETDKVDGRAQVQLINDAQAWHLRLDTDDTFNIVDNTGGITSMTFATGGSGNVGIGGVSPSILLDVNAKTGFTSIGGHVIKLTNKTGVASVAGQLVEVDTILAVDDSFRQATTASDGVIGVVYNAGVANNSEVWIVVSGIADVLIDTGGCARGDRLISSPTAGSADVWNVGGAVATHFQEIGHCLETRVGEGLARVVLHFN